MAIALEPLWDVVEEHLDEAEFLFEQWEHALVAPNYTLEEVADGPEARLMAHLDGLVVNGPLVARKLLLPTIDDEDAEPFRVRAAALALLQTPGDAGLDAVLAALREAPALRPALTRALECSDHPLLLPRLRPLLADDELRATAARVLGFHHQPLAPCMPALLASEAPDERVLGLSHLAFETGASPSAPVLAGLTAADPAIRDAALTAGVLLKIPPAWRRARDLAAACDPDCGHALLLLALRGDPADVPLILAALARPELRAAALWALGFVGTAAAVEASLDCLEDAEHGRLAGEVLTTITGIDLDDEQLTRPDDPDDEPLAHRPEHDLPRPDPIATLLWWSRNGARFPREGRLLRGGPLDTAAVLAGLHTGPMRRRPALALDLLLRTGIHNRLAPLAPTPRQRAELSGLR